MTAISGLDEEIHITLQPDQQSSSSWMEGRRGGIVLLSAGFPIKVQPTHLHSSRPQGLFPKGCSPRALNTVSPVPFASLPSSLQTNVVFCLPKKILLVIIVSDYCIYLTTAYRGKTSPYYSAYYTLNLNQ